MFTLGPNECIVGLGSNGGLGGVSAIESLRRAKRALAATPGFRLKRVSAIYRSDALLPPDAPASWNRPFLNGAALLELEQLLSPARLIAELKRLEKELGREPAPRWAPRIIDLDLLAWGRPDYDDGTLQVPHAELMRRPFALLPALDCLGPSKPQHPWRWLTEEQIPERTSISSEVWPEIVGILNLTPDSFSDGGKLQEAHALEALALRLLEQGAEILDVGAESTRPGARPVTPSEEIDRLRPAIEVLNRIREDRPFKLSLDSRHAQTQSWAQEHAHLDWINDVEGFSDPEMLKVAARSRCELVAMHSLGVPPSLGRTLDPGLDPVTQILEWGRATIRRITDAGISPDRIILDPGLGFGKTPDQNLELVRRSSELLVLGVRVLIGHSRKRFLDPTQRIPAAGRDLESAVVTAQLAQCGVDYLRVHSPESNLRALRLGARLR